MQHKETTIIRFPELQRKLGKVSRSTIDRWEQSKNFPRRIHLGKNSIGWSLAAIERWLSERSDNANTKGE